MKKTLPLGLTILAGLMDSVTGLLLVINPHLAMQLMGIDAAYTDWIFIRFVGTFVFAVGVLYVFGWGSAWHSGKWNTLRTIWMSTAWIRLCVCLYGTTAILVNELSADWWMVPLTDGVLGLLQVAWILSGQFPRS